MTPRRIIVNDLMQTGYEYRLTERIGQNFDPEFTPELTPPEMLTLGVFGGKYMTDCSGEFPVEWFTQARLSPQARDARLNYFGVNASQSLAEWRRKGWLYDEDPRGWFQWYCRYYMGRRCPDDSRQIRRWRAARRHMAQIRKHCVRGNFNCRRRQKQALLHWAYDARNL
ncbi:MAG: hypothetical protein M3Z31_15750 [Pseudomonadota bacterium]|nr:hypothetical protein [Pseudomonadota bacterium]